VKIVYFGTPHFAAEVLRFLLENKVEVAAVVTQPDRPKGRSLQLTSSPVKEVAVQASLPIFQPEKASQEIFLSQLADVKADLYVVVAFGQILTQKLLDIPRLGCINVHASLLPKYRGAAPIQRCLMDGETETGVAIQKMVRKLDAGDVIASSKIAIPSEMTFAELEAGLIEITKPLLLQVIHRYATEIPEGVAQDESLVTYASKIEMAEGEIHWNRDAEELHNLIRAFSPRPGAWAWIYSSGERKRLKILRAKCVPFNGKPGELSPSAIVSCGKQSLQLIDVQPEGKKVMKAEDWLRGQKNISFLQNI